MTTDRLWHEQDAYSTDQAVTWGADGIGGVVQRAERLTRIVELVVTSGSVHVDDLVPR